MTRKFIFESNKPRSNWFISRVVVDLALNQSRRQTPGFHHQYLNPASNTICGGLLVSEHVFRGQICDLDLPWYNLGISKNRGGPPKIIHFNRVFRFKPSILGVFPYKPSATLISGTFCPMVCGISTCGTETGLPKPHPEDLLALALPHIFGWRATNNSTKAHLAVLDPEIKPFERLIFPTNIWSPQKFKRLAIGQVRRRSTRYVLLLTHQSNKNRTNEFPGCTNHFFFEFPCDNYCLEDFIWGGS